MIAVQVRSVLLALGIVLGAATATVRADNKDDARAHVAVGDTHYKLGEFAEALAEYTRAYELYPAPPLLFNLGQCHRNLKQWDKAVFFFEGYLRERPTAKNRALVEDLLAEAHRELDKQRAAEAGAAAAAQRHADEVEQARLAAERQRIEEEQRIRLEAERRRIEEQQQREAERQRAEDARIAAEREDRDRDHLYRKWWFWSAVGSAALVAGGTAYYFSGTTTLIPPTGTLGNLDRR